MRGTALRLMECCLVTFALTAVLAHTLRMRVNSIDESADGAFRDGMYQATLDVQERRRPHVTSGRWNMEQDRLLFVTGYQKYYRILFDAKPDNSISDISELSGYCDGIIAGIRAGKGSQPFRLNPAESRAESQVTNRNKLDEHSYIQGYASGYQAGYFAEHGDELRTISHKIDRF